MREVQKRCSQLPYANDFIGDSVPLVSTIEWVPEPDCATSDGHQKKRKEKSTNQHPRSTVRVSPTARAGRFLSRQKIWQS